MGTICGGEKSDTTTPEPANMIARNQKGVDLSQAQVMEDSDDENHDGHEI